MRRVDLTFIVKSYSSALEDKTNELKRPEQKINKKEGNQRFTSFLFVCFLRKCPALSLNSQ